MPSTTKYASTTSRSPRWHSGPWRPRSSATPTASGSNGCDRGHQGPTPPSTPKASSTTCATSSGVIVLDASALVDVVTDQTTKGAVLANLDQPIVAPAHQLAEVLSALARLVRADIITADVARDALDEASALEQEHVTPRRTHLRRALELRANIRVRWLVRRLAQDRGCPLLTSAAGSPPRSHPATSSPAPFRRRSDGQVDQARLRGPRPARPSRVHPPFVTPRR